MIQLLTLASAKLKKYVVKNRLALAVTSGLLAAAILAGSALAHLHTQNPAAKLAPHTKHASVTKSPTPVVAPTLPGTPAEPAPTTIPHVTGQTQAKQPKALVISPSSFVMYKTSGYVQGLKPGIIDQIPVTAQANDGQAIKAPWSSDMFNYMTISSNDSAPYKAIWQFRANSSYAAVGVHTVTLTATSANGTKYSGTVQITVKTLPVFSVSTTTVYDFYQGLHTADYRFGPFDIDTSGLTDADLPTLEDQSPDVTCTELLEVVLESIHCGSFSDPPAGSYTVNFIFENQFQKIVVAGYLDILPY